MHGDAASGENVYSVTGQGDLHMQFDCNSAIVPVAICNRLRSTTMNMKIIRSDNENLFFIVFLAHVCA